ncbi:DUF309 domain-containing protein [Cyanobacterium stanieri LEGE 03274]|uniref:DUF309 domain-containing protein n=1 Tax=Cyanobacterium stanieri LEGE 03274 TaxID=1828756 RepID=A0ABR9V5X1_9CHRO|nr:DUF309 domain-containing protein [Cyanobacterium stanieri]MBE9223293.1 DUF309 domain-containing protein [Cyanobacterium stanieri LEGE 03274]
MDETQQLKKGIEQLNTGQFYACHDTLEEIWMEAPETEKKFYQGILQIAVGCYHLSNGNWRGAVILLGEGIRKLGEFEPSYYDLDIIGFTDDSYALLLALQKIEPEGAKDFYQQLLEQGDIDGVKLPKIYAI